VRQFRNDLTATLRMHPRDVDEVTLLLGDRIVGIEATGLKIVSDASLQLGNCVVETNGSDYDVSLETQLRRVHAALTGISDEI
jgi:flagellar biosynthesis/type III secretory pathway protein FliH